MRNCLRSKILEKDSNAISNPFCYGDEASTIVLARNGIRRPLIRARFAELISSLYNFIYRHIFLDPVGPVRKSRT